MSGLIVNGREVQVPSLKEQPRNWRDDPRWRLAAGDRASRGSTWVRGIVLHTTSGVIGQMLPGWGPDADVDEKVAKYWSTSPKAGGAHLVIDVDGSSLCLADLQTEQAYHATSVNPVTVGIEIGQSFVNGVATVYEEQLKQVLLLVDHITRVLGVQRQYQNVYHGSTHPVPRLVSGGREVVGVYGHRDQTTDRGEGDPGNPIMDLLGAAGYKGFDFTTTEDLTYWRSLQYKLNVDHNTGLTVDGIPGPATVAALKKAGFSYGLLQPRPGD